MSNQGKTEVFDQKLQDLKDVLPDELLEDPHLLLEILTTSTWRSLTSVQQERLSSFLPKFENKEETDITVTRLLSSSPISHHLSKSYPIVQVVKQLKQQQDSEQAELQSQYEACKAMSDELFKVNRMYNLVKQALIEQSKMNDKARPRVMDLIGPIMKLGAPKKKENMSRTALAKFNSIKETIKQDIERSTNYTKEELLTSDDSADEFTFKYKEPPFSVYKDSLYQHMKRRQNNVKTPDLDTTGIKLSDVAGRTTVRKKKSTASDVLNRRKKQDESSSSSSSSSKYQKQQQQQPRSRKRANEKTKGRRLNGMAAATKSKFADKTTRQVQTTTASFSPMSFFELIKQAISMSNDKTTFSIRSLTLDWLQSPQSSDYEWTTKRRDWFPCLHDALEYLRTFKISEDFGNGESSPLETLAVNNNGLWRWNYPTKCEGSHNVKGHDEEAQKLFLVSLCERWLDNHGEKSEVEMTASFQEQEAKRFLYSHQAFVYSVNGREYVVPPVKGSTPNLKQKIAREHYLLRSERPARVTLLALTRDAVARLPWGFGTRNDICNLVKQSQYIHTNVADTQFQSAVSGSLDRLHGESDPCVKYESLKKGWVYLHSDRSIKDFERIHSENLSTPRRKPTRKSKKPPAKRAKLQQNSNKPQQSLQLITADAIAAADERFTLVTSSSSTTPSITTAASSHTNGGRSLKKSVKKEKDQIHSVTTAIKSSAVTTSSNNHHLQLVSSGENMSSGSGAAVAACSSSNNNGGVLYKRLVSQMQQHQTGSSGKQQQQVTSTSPYKYVLRPGSSTGNNKSNSDINNAAGGGAEVLRFVAVNNGTANMTTTPFTRTVTYQQEQQQKQPQQQRLQVPCLRLDVKKIPKQQQQRQLEQQRRQQEQQRWQRLQLEKEEQEQAHQYLSEEALRRLSQDLSAASNRQIKIVHQTHNNNNNNSSNVSCEARKLPPGDETKN